MQERAWTETSPITQGPVSRDFELTNKENLKQHVEILLRTCFHQKLDKPVFGVHQLLIYALKKVHKYILERSIII